MLKIKDLKLNKNEIEKLDPLFFSRDLNSIKQEKDILKKFESKIGKLVDSCPYQTNFSLLENNLNYLYNLPLSKIKELEKIVNDDKEYILVIKTLWSKSHH